MSAFNVVRFRVKPDREEEFVAAHRIDVKFAGLQRAALVKTGEHTYCFVGEWDGFNSIVSARPQMIGILDSMRDCLEDLGGGIGLTDPVSGETVVDIAPRKAARKAGKKRAPAKAKKPAKKARKAAAKKAPAKKAKSKKAPARKASKRRTRR
jgi:hypothetical protein